MNDKEQKSDRQRRLDRAAARGGPIAAIDLKAIEYSEPWSDSLPVRAIGTVSEMADQPPLVTAGVVTLGIGLLSADRRLANTGARMLAAHALATQVKGVVKDHVDRPRPDKVARDGKHQVEEGTSQDGAERSLPSGHSAGAIAVARAVTREFPRAAPFAYGAAAIAAAVQVPRKAHFPSDVLLGLAIGLAAEWVADRAASLLDGD